MKTLKDLIIKQINSITTPDTIVILKGFNRWLPELTGDFIFAKNVTMQKPDVANLLAKISTHKGTLFATYEDLVGLSEMSLGGIFAASGKSVYILENDFYATYYPSNFTPKQYEELKAEYVAVENLIGAQTDGSTFNGHYHEKTSELSFRGVPVTIIFDIEAGQHHLAEDFAALEKAGIDNLIKTDFIAWLKGDNGTNISDETILAGLHLYGVNYQYGKIVAQYSPTGEEDNFGQFEFDFDCGNEECRDVFEAVAMQVYVHDGEIVKVSGFDI